MQAHGEPTKRTAGLGGSVPNVRPRTIRIDDATWAAAEAECQRRGLDSTAEYVRQALWRCLAVDHAVELIKAGVSPDDLSEWERLTALMAEVARRAEK